MKVKKYPEPASFCFGVKRIAVDKSTKKRSTQNETNLTLGAIIHNEGVVADLEPWRPCYLKANHLVS